MCQTEVPVPKELAASGQRPILLYDGDCAFCTACVRVLLRRVRPPVTLLAWQQVDLEHYGVTRHEAQRAVQWLAPEGRREGAQAFAAVLRSTGGFWWVIGALMRFPPLRQAA